MAAPKTLKSRIDKLFDALGGPVESRPSLDKIRSNLASFAIMAEALENGEATSEAEAQITALEAALEKSDTELAKLKGEIQTANAEIERFRAEQNEREEKEKKREMPDIQFRILKRLPTEHGAKAMQMIEICAAANISINTTEIHVHQLMKAGLAAKRLNFNQELVWYRTMDGNVLIEAKRLAGDEEPKEEIKVKRSKHGELSHAEEIALVTMAESLNEGAVEPEIAKVLEYTAAQTAFILLKLTERNMAAASDLPDYGAGTNWFILKKGLEHLAERGLI